MRRFVKVMGRKNLNVEAMQLLAKNASSGAVGRQMVLQAKQREEKQQQLDEIIRGIFK